MADEEDPPLLLKQLEDDQRETCSKSFEAKARYLASSLIVTIPVNVARELVIKLGDRLIIQIWKKEDLRLAQTTSNSSSSS